MISHSGIGTCVRGLLEGWRDCAPDFRPTLLGDPATLAHSIPDVARYPVVPFRAPIYGLYEQAAFPVQATRDALLHCPHYNIALRHHGPLVVTIHDLIHLDKRWGAGSALGRLYARFMLRSAVRRAAGILADSEATARDLARRLGVARDRVSVVYPAPAAAFLNCTLRSGQLDEFRREINLPSDYLLTIGLYKPHKNLELLFEAMKSYLGNEKIPLPLVMAGTRKKERPGLANRLAEFGIAARVHVLDWLPNDRMPWLYKGARAVVVPSLIEGFGLPIVEAQAIGTPVVASRVEAIVEAAGDGALFFDPREVADLARQVRTVIQDDGVRERLIAQGRRNVERFSWRESARKVLVIYEEVARASCL
jgi:glycosyltransferase involved in cell wall biosynthesis